MPKKHLGELKGDLFLVDEGNRSFTVQQIQLLQAIEQCGSITKAAKSVGISYKTAWDRSHDEQPIWISRSFAVLPAGPVVAVHH